MPRRWAAAHPGEKRKWLPDEVPYKPVKVGGRGLVVRCFGIEWAGESTPRDNAGLWAHAVPCGLTPHLELPCRPHPWPLRLPCPLLPPAAAAAQAGPPLRLRPLCLRLHRVLHLQAAAGWVYGLPNAGCLPAVSPTGLLASIPPLSRGLCAKPCAPCQLMNALAIYLRSSSYYIQLVCQPDHFHAAICTADLDQLKDTYSKAVRDLFEGRPEAYYPGE